MKILEQDRDGAVVKVRVEIPDQDLQPYFEKAYRKAQKTISIDGFRKGKVPLELIKKRYGESIRWDSIDDIIKEVYPRILEEAKLRPIAPGDIEDPSYSEGEPLLFTAKMEVFPEIKADNWKGHSVVGEKVLITDKDIDGYLENLQRGKAIISERGDDEGVENGDRITMDLQELDSAGTLVIGHRQEDVAIELGHNSLGEHTDEQLIGVKKGEVRRLRSKRLRVDAEGKESMHDFGWEVTVKKVEQVELPEVNEDFAAQVDESLSSVEELRNKVHTDMERFSTYTINQRIADRLITKLIETNTFDLPPSVLDETVERMVTRSMEDSDNKVSEEVLRENLTDIAEKQLRWSFLKDKLILDLELAATDEEIEKQLELRAGGSSEDLDNLKLVFKSEEKRDMLKREIIEGKLMDLLINNAQIEERPVDFSDVMRR